MDTLNRTGTIRFRIFRTEFGTPHSAQTTNLYITCFGTPKIAKQFSSELKNDGYNGIFTLNNASNINFVVTNWKQLVGFRFLNIYFVNPFSDSDKVWVICPYIHDKICDKSSLEAGLKSMSEMVNPIGSEELNNKIKLLR